ncbi:gliding motility-associated C-terminal domain-containing protein [Dysgonomonas sp. 511]|nr:gliding motility-associated C-terminal domain-containing protein [Dysgonomonas sp. 511]
MKKLTTIILSILLSIPLFAQYTVTGGMGVPYAYDENLAGTGIEKIYLLNSLSNATIQYKSSAISVNFYYYTNTLSDKVQVPASDISSSSSGGETTYTISNIQDSRGYMAEENDVLKAAVWIVDYQQHQPALSSVSVIENEDKCENIKLFIDKSDELSFYTVGGSKRNISRKYTISYNNLEWNGNSEAFEDKETIISEREIGTEIIINAPLMDTKFTLQGDQFAKHFGQAKTVESAPYRAIAVEAHMITVQEKRNIANEVRTEGTDLGGSAPVTINFYGYGNEPVAGYYTWFIYNKRDMNNPVARYTDKDIKYAFEESGDFIVKLEVAESTSICSDTTSVEFKVTESFLDIPNYFSPGDSPGSNDEFRVAYKSLVKFKCTIFNRWGQKLYESTDPAKGWDGRYGGRYVNTGVYFYVIEALGSDGIKYKKGGDINVIRSK